MAIFWTQYFDKNLKRLFLEISGLKTYIDRMFFDQMLTVNVPKTQNIYLVKNRKKWIQQNIF